MKHTWPVLIPLLALTAFGWWINKNLTSMHAHKPGAGGLFASVCTPEDNPQFNCDIVLQTKWAVFNPQTMQFAEPDPDTGAQTGIPVALLGWYYYTALFLWFLFVGRPSYAARYWHLAPIFMTLAGLGVSVFFMYILFTALDYKCAWCMVSHGINLLLAVGTLLLWPRRPSPAPAALPAGLGDMSAAPGGMSAALSGHADQQPAPAAPSSPALAPAPGGLSATPGGMSAALSGHVVPLPPVPSVEPHPAGRLVLVTLVAVAAVMASETLWTKFELQTVQAVFCKAELDSIRKDTVTQASQFKDQKQETIEVRPDDPFHGDRSGLLQMIVFSDFQCPACRRLAKEIDARILPAFGGRLTVIWKHLPGCKDCNPLASATIHPQACEAAYAAEAARAQGGNDAFWKVHDILFAAAGNKRLRGLNYREVAAEAGLDPERFLADMRSDATRKRIAEDAEQAKRLGNTGTPTVYLDGRKLPGYTVYNQEFLKLVFADYAKRHNWPTTRPAGPRPPATTAPAPTPGTPDQPGAE